MWIKSYYIPKINFICLKLCKHIESNNMYTLLSFDKVKIYIYVYLKVNFIYPKQIKKLYTKAAKKYIHLQKYIH